MFTQNSLRKLRQREYDSIELYSEQIKFRQNKKEKSQENFVKYFEALIKRRHKNNSESIKSKLGKERLIFLISYEGAEISFLKLILSFAEAFKAFLLNAPRGGNKSGILSQNSASTYFSVFKAALKQAFIDGYFTTDIAAKNKNQFK